MIIRLRMIRAKSKDPCIYLVILNGVKDLPLAKL
jgi:hypothetical protein